MTIRLNHLLVLALAILGPAGCHAKPEVRNDIVPPAGYDGLIVFMANAKVPVGMIQPVAGDNFQHNIMHRDDAAYEAERQQALAYFKERYGVANADTNPNFLFGNYQVEPFANYRSYYISGEKVPESGWEVRDGGWQMRVINPMGYTWTSGEFAGRFAPPGTYVAYGDYNILTNDCGGQASCASPREIVMHYQSRCPITIQGAMLPDVLTFQFSCEVFSDKLGQGLGQGLSHPKLDDLGASFQYNAREVITFSSQLGF